MAESRTSTTVTESNKSSLIQPRFFPFSTKPLLQVPRNPLVQTPENFAETLASIGASNLAGISPPPKLKPKGSDVPCLSFIHHHHRHDSTPLIVVFFHLQEHW
jgi:hypothetical protein